MVVVEALVNARSVESWGFFFSFLVDLPISMLFHSFLEGFAIQDRFWALLGMHVILGGAWWAIIFCGGLRLVSALRRLQR